MERRGFLLIGTSGFGALLVLFLISPYLFPPGSFIGLDGSPTVIDHGWQGLSGIGYLLGDIICHQQSSRSIMLNGNQMPICIRDLGLLIGLVAGLTICYLADLRLSGRRVPLVGLALVVITGVEWCLEYVMGDMPVPRIASGIVSGIGAAMILGWLLYKE